MPGAKRATKPVSYTQHNDDDDDFVSKVDNPKKTRHGKSDDPQIESTRQLPRKRKEKLSKTEQEELDLALKLSKDTVQTTEAPLESPVITNDKENTTSESTVSSNESKTTIEKEADEQDENSLPKSKRMKREEEEEDDTDESESNNDEEEEEEEDEPTPEKKPIRKTKEIKKNSEVPTVSSIALNPSRSTTRDQQKSSVSTSALSKEKSNIPIGFPTSKIVIPSLQTSRVGLSRKSSAIKPLHRNLNQRVVHE